MPTHAEHIKSLEHLKIYADYRKSKYLSVKHSSYFQVYEEVFQRFAGKPITLLEIGILNGGSLFMWRDYFGDQARIIGVDLNPAAKMWQDFGFEIYIGDQSDSRFWKEVFLKVGKVDIVLDDGGHTNRQQIVTTYNCIPHINDGGVLLIEDVHASYFREFGNPSKYSFINFSKKIIDAINSRFPGVSSSDNFIRQSVYSVSFFESIVCFSIDRSKCFVPRPTRNDGSDLDAEDFRHEGTSNKIINSIHSKVLNRLLIARRFRLLMSAVDACFGYAKMWGAKIDSLKGKKYFKFKIYK